MRVEKVVDRRQQLRHVHRLGEVADRAGGQGGLDLRRRASAETTMTGMSAMSGSLLRWRSSSRPLMSGRCMSSRIRCGRRARIGGQAVQAGHRHLQLHLAALRQDAAHDLDVGFVVLDVVDDAPVVVGRLGSRGRRGRSARCPGRSARGRRRMNDEPSPGTLWTPQRAAHQLGQAPADHQADAGALGRRALAAEPVERLEQLVHLRRGHAHAGVGDRDLDAVGGGPAGWRCGPGRPRCCT